MEKPLILLTNDDGIRSPGLYAAAEELSRLGELWIAAPRTQQTSAGRSHPPASSGIIREADGFPEGVRAFSIEASPSQCVDYAVLEILPRRPALTVSGINSGVNVGIDITRSGTIGAALEAANFEIPAVAVSLEIHQDEVFAAVPQADFSTAARFTARFAKNVLDRGLEADADLLKIEIPDDAAPDTPWELTRLSRKSYYRVTPPVRSSSDGSGSLGWATASDFSDFDEGTDVHTVFVKRMVAVTPVSLDMTSRIDLQRLSDKLNEKS